jgi:voltage-dependent potassium channel beta subunit
MVETTKKPEMEFRALGPSGLKVSVLSFGNWLTSNDKSAEETTTACIKRCWEHGINFFDTAEIYGNGTAEIIMSNAIKSLNVPREKLVISTKLIKGGDTVNERGLSRKHVVEGLNNSLKRLQLDYVDVVFCHRPDPETPVEETVRAFNHVIDQGKALYWGTSEHSAEQIQEIYAVCDRLGLIKPIVEQPQYSMLHRDRFEVEYGTLFDKYRMGSTIWSPLAGGILTGKYNFGIPAGSRFENSTSFSYATFMGDEEKKKRTIGIIEKLGDVAKELNASLAQLALAWTIANKDVSTAIFGATKVEQVDDNIKAIELYKKLTPEIFEKIEKILDNRPKPTMNFRTWSPYPPRR